MDFTGTGLDNVAIAFLAGFLTGWGLLPRPVWIEPYLVWIQTKGAAVFSLFGVKMTDEPKPLEPKAEEKKEVVTSNTASKE